MKKLVLALSCASLLTSSTLIAESKPAAPQSAPSSKLDSTATANASLTPEALVNKLYKTKESPFNQDKNRALVDQYFTKATADMIWKDVIEAKGEVGALDGDPLYNAQDTDIKKFAIGKAEIKGEQADVKVSFENLGKKENFTYKLVLENKLWKIQDIQYGGGDSLTKIYKINEDLMKKN